MKQETYDIAFNIRNIISDNERKILGMESPLIAYSAGDMHVSISGIYKDVDKANLQKKFEDFLKRQAATIKRENKKLENEFAKLK